MARTFQLKRGAKSSMPTLAQGELGFTTDSSAEELYVGNGSENIQIARQDYVDGATSGIQAQLDTLSSRTDWYSAGTSIPSGSDLDTYTTVGKYQAASESIAKSLLNCPTATNFTMHVFKRTSSTSINQMILALNGRIYMRGSNSSGVWRTWVEFATTDNLTTLETTLETTYATKAELEAAIGTAIGGSY